MTPEPDLFGLRDDDLSPSELALLDGLREDPSVASRMEAEDRLRSELEALPFGKGPDLDQLRRRVSVGNRNQRRARRLGAGAALLMAASALVFFLAQDSDQRDRGAAWNGAIHVEVAVEGTAGVAVHQGEMLRPDDRVLFRVTTSDAGYLRVEEGSPVVFTFPERGFLPLGPGTHAVGSDEGLVSFRPDVTEGSTRYRLVFCKDASGTECVFEDVTVRWQP